MNLLNQNLILWNLKMIRQLFCWLIYGHDKKQTCEVHCYTRNYYGEQCERMEYDYVCKKCKYAGRTRIKPE